MGMHVTALESFIHLALFVAGLGAIGVVALAVIDRLSEGPRAIRPVHAAMAVAGFLVLLGAERVYHLLA